MVDGSLFGDEGRRVDFLSVDGGFFVEREKGAHIIGGVGGGGGGGGGGSGGGKCGKGRGRGNDGSNGGGQMGQSTKKWVHLGVKRVCGLCLFVRVVRRFGW